MFDFEVGLVTFTRPCPYHAPLLPHCLTWLWPIVIPVFKHRFIFIWSLVVASLAWIEQMCWGAVWFISGLHPYATILVSYSGNLDPSWSLAHHLLSCLCSLDLKTCLLSVFYQKMNSLQCPLTSFDVNSAFF